MPLFPILQDQIKIEALKGLGVQADGSSAYEGEVIVTYGLTKVTADRIVLYQGEQRGVAEGRVTLVDPDGTAQADRIEFIWNPLRRSGSAENVLIQVVGATLKARRAVFNPGEWTLFDAEGTTCLRPNPVYYVTSERVVIRPGQQLEVREPRVSLLGKFIGELPSQRVSLSPAVPGIHLPTPSYRVGRGFGLTWNGGVVAGRDSAFTFNARSFQQQKPSAFAQYTRSFLPLANASEIVAPRTDFGERFSYGYLDSVNVGTPEEERQYLRAARSSLSGGAQLNGSIVDRERGTRYTKFEVVAERGTSAGGYGFLGQARLQSIRREEADFVPRATFMGSVGLPSVSLGSNLSTIARVDSQAFVGETGFGWARAMAGVTYTPTKWLRLSGAGFVSGEVGTPQFDIDPLYSKSGLLMRADVAFGGLRLSYLAKNDTRRGFYDREISVNQVIGCFEAFYLRRQYPRDSRLGLTLRVQPLIDMFRRRGLNRQPQTAPASP